MYTGLLPTGELNGDYRYVAIDERGIDLQLGYVKYVCTYICSH